MKTLAFIPLVVIALAIAVASGCVDQKNKGTLVQAGRDPGLQASLVGSTPPNASDPCAIDPTRWMADLEERSDSSGQVFKEATWSTNAPCGGDGGCTLVQKTIIRFYRDVVGRTPTGRLVPGTKRVTMSLWVQVPGKRSLTQSFRAFDAGGKGRFALGPDTWNLPRDGTYECVWDYGTYPDDEYPQITRVCRAPSTCE